MELAKATVDDVNHKRVHNAVKRGLTDLGWQCADLTPYDAVNDDNESCIDALRLSHTATARNIRSRNDTTYTYSEHGADIVINVDYKSNPGPWPNMVLELHPLCYHLIHAECLNDRMMYIYGDYRKGALDRVNELKSVWCSDVPNLATEVHISTDTPNKQFYIDLATRWLPNAKIREYQFKPSANRNDPFVVIPHSAVVGLKHPREIFETILMREAGVLFVSEADNDDDDE